MNKSVKTIYMCMYVCCGDLYTCTYVCTYMYMYSSKPQYARLCINDFLLLKSKGLSSIVHSSQSARLGAGMWAGGQAGGWNQSLGKY